MGYSQEAIEEFEKERKENKKRLSENNNSFFTNNNDINHHQDDLIFSWFNGTITSSNNRIFPIDTVDNANLYCYLDEVALVAQDCDRTKLYAKRLKLDGYHLKKLDTNKATFQDHIIINNEIREISYTHELKLNKLDRVLCFPQQSDNMQATLLIGIRFIAGGLHSSNKIHALQTSTKSNKESLILNLPNSESELATRFDKQPVSHL